MKVCPNCQTANEDQSRFCEQCGYDFSKESQTEPEQPTRTAQNSAVSAGVQATRTQHDNKKKNSKLPIILTIVVSLVAIAGLVLFFIFRPNSDHSATPASSASSSSTAESASEADSSKYDDLIAEAKQLTIEGKFKESELKLASIPVSDLAKVEFSAVKEAVESLTVQNNKGIQESKNEEEKNETETNNSGFTGDYAKWANTFTFYYSQAGQKQSTLTITANGGVTQNNYDSTQFFGKAKIEGASGSILSYETNALYPSRMPATKQIDPNVKITVTWDNGGGSQVYYGYLSYSSRLALTDGNSKGAGVNEVWISY